MADRFNTKIYFYCCKPGSPDKTAYQHAIVCLAEGFKQLGIQSFANINYWQLSPGKEDYLISHNPQITPDDCSVVVLNQEWFEYHNPLPENLFHPNRKYLTVYIDCSDGIRTFSWNPEFRQFDFILKAHYNSQCEYPANFRPWAFGISNRILQETDVVPSMSKRKRHLLANFRVTQPLREIVKEKLFPYIQKVLPIDNSIDNFNTPPLDAYHHLQWSQTGRRHYPSYYNRLKESAACATFGGGAIVPSWPKDPATVNGLMGRSLRKMMYVLDLGGPKRILQWDSWRLWESLAAGCVTFHVDFEKYGFRLPVMPENWRHYVGIDLDNIEECVNRIADEPEILEKISTEGRRWAIAHYTSVPIAQRFLDTIKNSPVNKLYKDAKDANLVTPSSRF